MSSMEFLFLDLDDTILDFHKAERLALSRTIRHFGAEPTEALLGRYHVINKEHWEALERGELTRPQVLTGRFRQLFQELGLGVDPQSCAKVYEANLSQGHFFLPGAEEAVKSLSGKYRLFLASNGTASVQHGRMTSAGLYPYFEKVFISQEIGCNKPARAFFESCFAQIPGFRRERAMMVGDSLTSDIRGGLDAGLLTCWVSPDGRDPGDIQPHYRIESIAQLEALLDTL